MELILWRHAEAEDGAPDASRALTRKGIKQAQRMAKWLAPRLPDGTQVLASPARRTVQTASELTSNFTTDNRLSTSGDAESLLAATGWPKRRDNILIVGHMPTLGEAAALLLTGKVYPWELKKGAIFWLTLNERLGATRFQLRAAISPKLL